MRNIIVTIVIPVYNVERYLDRCIESIVNQTYHDLEVILIDDCSCDNSSKQCDEWARKDKRIHVIHKLLNEGAGKARNDGLDGCTGEYVFFLDSDDYISLNAIEICLKSVKSTDADAVLFGHYWVDENGRVTSAQIPVFKRTLYEGDEVENSFLPDLIAPDPKVKNAPVAACARAVMFKTEVLKKNACYFVSEREILSEDLYFFLNVYHYIQKVAIISEGLYYYCKNIGSLTHSYRKDYHLQAIDCYEKCRALCKVYGYGKKIEERLLLAYLSFSIAALKQEVADTRNVYEQLRSLRKIIVDPLLQGTLQAVRKDKMSLRRKILFGSVRHKLTILCWILLKSRG